MGVKYTSKFRQNVSLDAGHMAPRGRRVGSTFGERRKLANAGHAEAPKTQNRYERAKAKLASTFSASGATKQLPAANAQFLNGTTKHPLQQLGEGTVAKAENGSDDGILAYLNTITGRKA